MRIEKPRLSIAYRQASVSKQLELTARVAEMLYTSGNFATPPVTLVALEAASTALTNAVAAQAQGGTLATMAKNLRRTELVDLLDKLVWYVQLESEANLVKLVSSGFNLIHSNSTKSPLPKPTGFRASNGAEGQTIVGCDTIPNARVMELQKAEVSADGTVGAFEPAGLHTSFKRMVVDGLVPGTLHAYRGRGVGGSTGYSEWSDTILHRAA